MNVLQLPLLLPALLAAGGLAVSCGSDPADPARTVAVEVEEVALDRGGNPVILLKERGGARRLPIWVGISEARSIASRLEDVEPIRPNTHDLAKRLLEGLDGRVERVVVTALRRSTYYGLIVMQGPDGALEIDSRPSDAIAIALRTGAPIFVVEALFAAGALPDPDERGPPGDDDERRRAI